MTDNSEIMNIEVSEENENIPATPYVNEKVKIYLLIFVIVLAIASSLLVVFCSETPDDEAGDTANSAGITVTQLL